MTRSSHISFRIQRSPAASHEAITHLLVTTTASDTRSTGPLRRGRRNAALEGAATSQTRARHEGAPPLAPQPRFLRSVTWLTTSRLNLSVCRCPHTSAAFQSVFKSSCQDGMQRAVLHIMRNASGCRNRVGNQHVPLHPPYKLVVLPSSPQAP